MWRGSAFWCERDVIDSDVPVWTDSAVLAFKRHLSIKQEWKQRSYFRWSDKITVFSVHLRCKSLQDVLFLALYFSFGSLGGEASRAEGWLWFQATHPLRKPRKKIKPRPQTDLRGQRECPDLSIMQKVKHCQI